MMIVRAPCARLRSRVWLVENPSPLTMTFEKTALVERAVRMARTRGKAENYSTNSPFTMRKLDICIRT